MPLYLRKHLDTEQEHLLMVLRVFLFMDFQNVRLFRWALLLF